MDINDPGFGHRSFITHTTGLKERIEKAEKENQMRKYRGLTKDGKWVYGNLIVNNAYDLVDGVHPAEPLKTYIRERDLTWVSEPDNKRWTHLSFEVIPETVKQSTGLKDKKRTEEFPEGQEIFGGDIIRYMDGKNMEVFYSTNGYAGWKLRRKPNHGKGLLVYGLYNRKGGSGAEEVIGNVHQHPKLLEQDNA